MLNRGLTTAVVLGTALALIGPTGCASKKKTQQALEVHESRLENLEDHAEKTDEKFVEVEKKIEEFSETALEALNRAAELGEASRLIDEVVLREDIAEFKSGSAALSDRAKSFLTEFGNDLKEKNENIYLEIQGHTDRTGDYQTNLDLGERRAEAVYEFLAKEMGIPLHRMRTISYAWDKPIADNDTKEGRAQNRRVVLVVLK